MIPEGFEMQGKTVSRKKIRKYWENRNKHRLIIMLIKGAREVA